VALDGELVSSTRIREAFARAIWMPPARCWAGRIAMCGRVLEGVRSGRQLGFPTANLDRSWFGAAAERRLRASTQWQGHFLSSCFEYRVRPTIATPAGVRVKHIFWISLATFTARSWKWKSALNCRSEQHFGFGG